MEQDFTITSPIYRDIAEAINKTTFDMYVKDSYRPIIHPVYIEHPEIRMINLPDPFEMDNLAHASLPLKNIIDMYVTGQEFSFVHWQDIEKAKMLLKVYIDKFEGVPLDKDPAMKTFLENAKATYDAFAERVGEQKAKLPKKEKKLSIADRIALLGMQV